MQPKLGSVQHCHAVWKKVYISLVNNRSKLCPEVVAVEPFFPQYISAAFDIVSAYVKGEAYSKLHVHVFYTTYS